jgi:hypothetical protein
MTMQRNGARWKVVGVKDEQIATDIARSVGQQIIALASNKTPDAGANRLGIANLMELVKEAEEAVGR